MSVIVLEQGWMYPFSLPKSFESVDTILVCHTPQEMTTSEEHRIKQHHHNSRVRRRDTGKRLDWIGLANNTVRGVADGLITYIHT